MRSGIGSLLRAERERRGIELSDVEAATRIRAELLEAVEAEDWDRIPGDAYARAFARTYASYLNVDVEPFLDEPPPVGAIAPLPARRRRAGRRRRLLPAAIATLVVSLAAAVAVLVPGSGSGSRPNRGVSPDHPREAASPPPGVEGPAAAEGMALELTAKAELWVCLLDSKGDALVDGIVLSEGAEEGPFRSGSFTVSFGNGEVEMRIDGRETEIPESGSPLGYAIGRAGELSPLSESERPTCT